MVLLDCLQSANSVGHVVLEFIQALGPVIVGLLALLVGYHYNKRLLTQKNHEDERKEIYKKLNSFYGPMKQLLGVSLELYERLTASRATDFRTLVALLSGEKFQGNDKILLEQILEVGEHMDKLILEQSGLVDDEQLQKLLSQMSAHFRVIRLAYKGDLVGQASRFEGNVFPRDITTTIEKEITRLKKRLDELNAM
jgi:hypothetical protein